MKKILKKANREKSEERGTGVEMPLVRINFILMAVSAVIIIVGFLLMLGGNSGSEGFNPDIFSTRRIVVGPTMAFIGFVAMGIAIIYRPKSKG